RALPALALQLAQPSAVAQRFFGREIYGRNPYGRSATRDGYRAAPREDVAQFARQRLRPAGALLVVAGDVTDARVQELVAKAFEGWRGAPASSPPLPAPATRVATDILLVHRPGAAQANIAPGNTTILPTDPGYYPGRVATPVLGGGADSRHFLIPREQKSRRSGPYASLHRYRGRGAAVPARRAHDRRRGRRRQAVRPAAGDRPLADGGCGRQAAHARRPRSADGARGARRHAARGPHRQLARRDSGESGGVHGFRDSAASAGFAPVHRAVEPGERHLPAADHARARARQRAGAAGRSGD